MAHFHGFLLFLLLALMLFLASMVLAALLIVLAIAAKVWLWWRHTEGAGTAIRVAAHHLQSGAQESRPPSGED